MKPAEDPGPVSGRSSAPGALARRLVAEGIGTFFVVLIGPGTVMVDAYSGGEVGHPRDAFLLEGFLSFVLMFVIMAAATDQRVPGGLAAIGVGMTVGCCALMGGPLTGAGMNPARSFGPALVGGIWRAHWGSTGWVR